MFIASSRLPLQNDITLPSLNKENLFQIWGELKGARRKCKLNLKLKLLLALCCDHLHLCCAKLGVFGPWPQDSDVEGAREIFVGKCCLISFPRGVRNGISLQEAVLCCGFQVFSY